MSWRLSIRHRTGYRYQGEVRSSYNEARVTPLSTDRQVALEASVSVDPAVSTYRYWDYWSTMVDAFDIHVPHTEMTVVGESVVETSPPLEEQPVIDWDGLSAPEVRDIYAEMLAPTTHVPEFEEASDAARFLAEGRSPVEAVEDVCTWSRE
ncbi:MAG: transglutaminase family protein, partial [Actinobacteria bacterium]|nr:transglutaminase family protein [Actinomycetota bacterium]